MGKIMSFSSNDLIRGQENLDRMKKHIKITLEHCIRGLPAEEFREKARKGRNSSKLRIGGEDTATGWIIELENFGHIYKIQYTENLEHIYATMSDELYPPKLEYIQQVYASLPDLLERITSLFPNLEIHLSPYLRAAKVKC